MATNADLIREIAVSNARIEEGLKGLRGDVEDLTKIIKGNGHPGLVDRVGCLEEKERNREAKEKDTSESAKEVKQTRWDLKSKIIVAMASAIFTLLVFIVEKFLIK